MPFIPPTRLGICVEFPLKFGFWIAANMKIYPRLDENHVKSVRERKKPLYSRGLSDIIMLVSSGNAGVSCCKGY